MTSAPGTSPPAAAKPSLRQRFRGHILHPEFTAEQVAWSFAIGFAIAWNPLIGTHTTLILIVCFAFRGLHRPLMLLAAFINNPWTLVPMATVSAYLGNLLLGRGLSIDLSGVHWKEIGWRNFTSWEGLTAMHRIVEPVLVPYLLGGFAFSLLSLVIGFYGMRWLTLRLRKVHWKDIHLPHPHFHLHAPAEPADPAPDNPKQGPTPEA